MGQWDGLNRRKFPRVNYPCLVVVGDAGDNGNIILTHTENIGIGGVCVTLKKSLKVFTPVNLELDLLDLGNHIKCKGKVVWNVRRKMEESNKPLFYDIGIEFTKLSQTEHQRLEDIVDKLVKNHKDTSHP